MRSADGKKAEMARTEGAAAKAGHAAPEAAGHAEAGAAGSGRANSRSPATLRGARPPAPEENRPPFYARWCLTLCMCAVCIVVYVVELLLTPDAVKTLFTSVPADVLYSTGGDSYSRFQLPNDLWRLVASSFVHADFNHILGNLACMVAAGAAVETMMGKWRYALIVLASSAMSDVVACFWALSRGEDVISVGISGVFFGVVAAGVVFVVFHPEHAYAFPEPEAPFMAASIGGMFASAVLMNGSFVGHMGGLLGGALCALAVSGPGLEVPAWLRVLATAALAAIGAAFCLFVA